MPTLHPGLQLLRPLWGLKMSKHQGVGSSNSLTLYTSLESPASENHRVLVYGLRHHHSPRSAAQAFLEYPRKAFLVIFV